MTRQKVEKAIFANLRKHGGGLKREEVIGWLPSKFRFEAALLLLPLVEEKRVIEVRGRYYLPGSSAALAVLRAGLSEAS